MDLITTSSDNDNSALKVAQATDFLPRLQLYGAKSGACGEGRIPIGHYGLASGDDIDDLGDEVQILVCAARPKALDLSSETVTSYFKEDSPEFQDIRERSAVKDSGCMYGPEYLVFVPEAPNLDGPPGRFATFFLGSKTMRREAKAVHARLRKAGLLTAVFIKKPKYSWHGPKCEPIESCALPSQAAVDREIKRFTSEKGSQVETIKDSGRDR